MQQEQIIAVLGKPYFSNDRVMLYNLDCKKGLEQLAEHNIKVNTTITSPPYNIGKEYEKPLSLNEYIQ